MPPKFLENIVILCFERRFSKQNIVIGLKSNILAPKFLGWLLYFNALPGIFAVIHCSVCVLRIGVKRGGGGPRSTLDFENFNKKGCFLSYDWEKTNFTTFVSPGKIWEKSPGGPPTSMAFSAVFCSGPHTWSAYVHYSDTLYKGKWV